MTTDNHNTIYQLIREMGRTMTLIQNTLSSYVPGVGISVDSNTTHSITAIFLEYSDAERKYSRIEDQDRKCVIAGKGLSVVPTQDDFVMDGSDKFRVVRTNVVKQANTVIAYICQVRG